MSILSRILAATLLLLPTAALAQQSDPPALSPSASFDVVSIKPGNPNGRGGTGFFSTGFTSTYSPLVGIIYMAYFPPFTGDRILEYPAWTMDEHYDIVAHIDEADATAWLKLIPDQKQEPGRRMLQKVLADRFKLAAHLVPAQFDGFALVVSKASRITPTKPGETYPAEAREFPDGTFYLTTSSSAGNTIRFFNAPVSRLIQRISTNWVIQDQTNLTGRYDFTIHPLELPRDSAGKALPNLQFSDFWDISETGLTLKPAKIPTQNLVIDHIERPTPN